jgi:hypothetical protein
MKPAVEKGDDYEAFVEDIYGAMLNANASISGLITKGIEKKKVIDGHSGATNEFDLYWEYELAGVSYRTAIECKDYASTISVLKVRDFAYKLRDCGNIKGVFATTRGYQSGAKKIAQTEGIELLVIRKMTDEDWKGRIRKINVDMHLSNAPQITAIDPKFNIEWMTERFDLKPGDSVPISLRERTDRIFIDDRAIGKRVSIFDMESDVLPRDVSGEYEWREEFKDAFLVIGEDEYKIDALNLRYNVPDPIQMNIRMDFGDKIKGLVENIHKQHQTVIFKDGTIRKEEEAN